MFFHWPKDSNTVILHNQVVSSSATPIAGELHRSPLGLLLAVSLFALDGDLINRLLPDYPSGGSDMDQQIEGDGEGSSHGFHRDVNRPLGRHDSNATIMVSSSFGNALDYKLNVSLTFSVFLILQ